MTATVFTKCLKAWQTKEPLFVLQVSPTRAMRDAGHKKAYLVLDARQDSFGVSLVFEKPALTFSSGAFAEIFRKHLGDAAVGRILHHPSSGDWWLEVWQSPEACWWLKVQKSRPPELVLVNAAEEALIRFGAKGTFTKKKAYEGDHPARTEGFDERSDIMTPSAPAEEMTETEADEDMSGLFSPEQRELTKRFKRRLKTLKKSFEKDAAKTRAHEDPARLREEAELLRAFAHRVRPGAFELVLTSEETGREDTITLTLDPDRSVGDEINDRFERAKRARRGHDMGQARREEVSAAIAAVESDLERLAIPLTPSDLHDMARRHGLLEKQKVSSSGEPVSLPYRVYRSSLGHRLLVGKGAKDNDVLTRAAKANDWWLHAVGVTGSHVIVPTDKALREALPTATLREAAILALHYSKIKGDLAGEVYVTRRQHLRKQKGLADGLWLIDRSETLFFRYSPEERDQVLGRQEA